MPVQNVIDVKDQMTFKVPMRWWNLSSEVIEMPEMKYYIVYANWKPELQSMDAMKEAMEK